MALARCSLILCALTFGGFGVWLLLQPQALSLVGLELDTAAARAEIRAFYGGLELGFAVFFALSAAHPAWFAPALVAQAATLGGSALGRLSGVLIDGTRDGLILALVVAEAGGCLLGLVALSRARR